MIIFKEKHPETLVTVRVVRTIDGNLCEFFAWLSHIDNKDWVWNISNPDGYTSYPAKDTDKWEEIVYEDYRTSE